MPNFIIVKNNKVIDLIHANGNVKALHSVININEPLAFPMHVHEGLLFANVGDDIFMVFESTDGHAHDLALSITKKAQGAVVKKKHAFRLPRLFQLPTLALEAPAYVV